MYDHSARESSHKSLFWSVCEEKRLRSEGESASCFQSLPVVTSTHMLLCFAPCTWRCSVKRSSSVVQQQLERSIGVLGHPPHAHANESNMSCFSRTEPLQQVHCRSCTSRTRLELCELCADSWQSDHKDSTAENWDSYTCSSAIYFPVDSAAALQFSSTTHSKILFFRGFQHLAELIVVRQAKKKKTREKEKAPVARPSPELQRTNVERSCSCDPSVERRTSTGFGACVLAYASTSIKTSTARESTRSFVVAVRMRSHERESDARFCFCWGGGGGQPPHLVKNMKLEFQLFLLGAVNKHPNCVKMKFEGDLTSIMVPRDFLGQQLPLVLPSLGKEMAVVWMAIMMWVTARVHKNKSMQHLISSLWGPGTAKFQVMWLLRNVQKGVSMWQCCEADRWLMSAAHRCTT